MKMREETTGIEESDRYLNVERDGEWNIPISGGR